MSRILGIDPGIRRTGFGIVEASGTKFKWVAGGVIRPPVDAALHVRLLTIEKELGQVIALHAPGCCAVESVFYHKNPKSMLTLGQAQAAAILAAAHAGLELGFYSPGEVKLALTGGGHAGKEQVRFMVGRILGLDLGAEVDDMSDALAIAICHAGRAAAAVAGRS